MELSVPLGTIARRAFWICPSTNARETSLSHDPPAFAHGGVASVARRVGASAVSRSEVSTFVSITTSSKACMSLASLMSACICPAEACGIGGHSNLTLCARRTSHPAELITVRPMVALEYTGSTFGIRTIRNWRDSCPNGVWSSRVIASAAKLPVSNAYQNSKESGSESGMSTQSSASSENTVSTASPALGDTERYPEDGPGRIRRSSSANPTPEVELISTRNRYIWPSVSVRLRNPSVSPNTPVAVDSFNLVSEFPPAICRHRYV
mmetsp:Transcript_49330/g.117161  ORF Transcript_49330/g.117161 Transcript_49330/m.117161 type:complete len:266 (-) Transcript_49330:290-1087(-)